MERDGPRLPSCDVPPPRAEPRRDAVGTGSLWQVVERAWLAPTREPVSRRIARHGWRADDPFVFCPRCASGVGAFEADASGCAACRRRRLPWERALRLGEYTGLLRDLILELKFERWRPAGDALGESLAGVILSALDAARLESSGCVLVPVPTSFRRRLGRGIDHTLCLVRAISGLTGIPVARPLVRRHGPPQWAVPPSERWRNVADSFRPRPGRAVEAETLIVVDDIRTTGATLSAVCRTLARSGVRGRVWVATAAVARSRR